MSRHEHDGAVTFAEDPRYAVSWRELWISVAYWAGFSAAVVLVAWLLGGGKKATEIEFVLGFPAWFFWSSIVCSLAFSIVPYFLVKRWFTDMPLGTHGDGGEDR
ncbi:MAG: DUF997 family protein [Streptosporangiales bacterium]